MDFFGFTIKRKDEEEKKKNESFVAPEKDDGATTVTVGADSFNSLGTYFDADGAIKGEVELITKYREMAQHPEVQSAIEDIVNEAIIMDENDATVELVLDDVEGLSEKMKDKINDEFKEILDLFEFNDKAFDAFQKWYVDGRQYYHIIIDPNKPSDGIKELRYIDPRKIRKMRVIDEEKSKKGNLTVKKVKEEFFVYMENGFLNKVKGNLITYKEMDTIKAVKIAPDSIVYTTSGLLDENNRTVLSYLHKAIKPLNQLRMMEDAVVIYRITRAPERRVFRIDVGDLPKAKAEEHIKNMMTRHKNKLVYNAQTGEIKDDRRFLTMSDDYWFATRQGNGTDVDVLPGGQQLGEMDEINYFLNKLYRSLNVPISRTEPDTNFSFGRPSEITRDELKFSKFINRLRNRFSMGFTIALGKQLLLKNIVTPDEWVEIEKKLRYRFLNDNQFEELKNLEITRERISALDQIDPHVGVYYSKEYVRKHILQQTDEEIAEIEKQIESEKKEDFEDDSEIKQMRGFGTPDMTGEEEPPRENAVEVNPLRKQPEKPKKKPENSSATDKEESKDKKADANNSTDK